MMSDDMASLKFDEDLLTSRPHQITCPTDSQDLHREALNLDIHRTAMW